MSLSHDEFMRYSRHLLISDIGEEGQQRLKRSRIFIVGMGGLGCPVALYMAAAGVGHLYLCDPDDVEKSNLQRQILYRDSDCGSLKVDAAERALLALNPHIEVHARAETFDAELLPDDCDLVLDCTDNLGARHAINRACIAARLPLISASALGWEGQLMSFDFRQQSSPCLACLLPEGSAEPLMNCGNAGVVGPVLGAMGSLQAISALRILLGKPVIHGDVQRFDGATNRWLGLTASTSAECGCCTKKI